MSSLHRRRTRITALLDAIFVHTFGKGFIADTLFHEVGHLVYNATVSPSDGDDKEASEEIPNKYAARIYGEIHPIRQGLYPILNTLYHIVFYRHRIAHDDDTSGVQRRRCSQSAGKDARLWLTSLLPRERKEK